MKLGEILLDKKWITPSQLEQIIEQQSSTRQRLGEIMVQNNIITLEQLDKALKEQYWRNNGYWVIH